MSARQPSKPRHAYCFDSSQLTDREWRLYRWYLRADPRTRDFAGERPRSHDGAHDWACLMECGLVPRVRSRMVTPLQESQAWELHEAGHTGQEIGRILGIKTDRVYEALHRQRALRTGEPEPTEAEKTAIEAAWAEERQYKEPARDEPVQYAGPAWMVQEMEFRNEFIYGGCD
jgi:hypothetical protein